MVDLLAPFLIRAYIALILSGAAASAGSGAVLRGVSYLPAEASHAALGGVSVAVFLGYVLGINVKFYDYLMFFLIGLSGGLISKIFGRLLVFALVLAPAAAARMFSAHVRAYLINTVVLTVLLGMLGLLISIYLDLPSSGTIAGLTSAAYVVSLLYFKAMKKG